MGLLDEAIREHLELKRKRGSDPTDLARQEQEALGPAVREPAEPAASAETAAPEEPPAEIASAEAPAADLPLEPAVPDPEGPGAHHPTPDEHLVPDPEAPPPPPAPPPPEPEPAPEPEAATEIQEPPAEEPPPPAPEPEPEPPPEPPPPEPSTTAQETAVFDVDDVFAEEDAAREGQEPREEDVLEETPDFLQETPEHDRLWFEQKPPKDFDFDG